MLLAAYGSLKKGFHNHRLLADAEFLGTDSVHGVMYFNGSYPKLYVPLAFEGTFSDYNARTHEIEVYGVDHDIYNYIDAMERGAGYVAEDIYTKYGKATIFYMPHERFDESDKWIEAYTH
jgi:gamma-glutamylcyclotransferase (GGCT)/AIG2-like uncharacterized protein YtfP